MQHPQKAYQPPRVPEHNNPPKPTPRVHIQNQVPAPAPRVNPKKYPVQEPVGRCTRSQYQTSEQPIARRTRSQLKQSLTVTPAQAAQHKLPKELLALCCTPETSLDHLAMSVLDPETGNTMEYRQLRRHPKYKKIWETSYCNELGRLFQGIGTGDNRPKNNASPGQKHSRSSDIKISLKIAARRYATQK